MKTLRISGLFVVMLGVMSLTASAEGPSLPDVIKKIEERAKKAELSKVQLEEKARQERINLEKVVKDARAKLDSKVESVSTTAKELADDVVCSIHNKITDDEMRIRVDGSSSDVTKDLGSITSDEKPNEKLAIRFMAKKDAGSDSIQFQLIDRNAPNQKTVRNVDLGALGLEAKCVRAGDPVKNPEVGAAAVANATEGKTLIAPIDVVLVPVERDLSAVEFK